MPETDDVRLPLKEIYMGLRMFISPVVAVLFVASTAFGGPLASSSAAVGAYTTGNGCHTKNGFKSCGLATSSIIAKGTSDGVCADYPAYEQVSGPSGRHQTRHHKHWCGSLLKVSDPYEPGVYYASLWEGPNSSGKYIRLVSAKVEVGA